MNEAQRLRVDRLVYGGYGFARAVDGRGAACLVPLTLPDEIVEAAPAGSGEVMGLLRVLQPSPERVQPGCPHFGACGGCHLQMASYAEQLRLKREVLEDALRRAGVVEFAEITTHAAEPWGYRNRIRLHIVREDGTLRLGYRERKSRAVLPIMTCPIAAPVLWHMAETMLALAERDATMQRWLNAADEVELFCDDRMARVQVTLVCTSLLSMPSRESFEQAMKALQVEEPALAGAGAVLVHPRTGQIQREFAEWGSAGLHYQVAGERYWIARGGFFQVNRFLLPALVELVCANRRGRLAWDLFAGVGLFALVLAHNFERVTAVEANPAAARELGSSLQRVGLQHTALNEVTVAFLRRAMLERDRPELVVLDPPRAGAGREVCELLARVASEQIVYVACDPVTLARDCAVLQKTYTMEALHLVDLFPQTYHQEAVVVLRRRS
ncbi:MAG TPA: 23S rRNA (uracil(1939)-C(5))-methyltransferase RlmD [Acidobacteriaceae bacterium]